MADIAALLDPVCEIARRAGDRILEVYARDFDVETKSDDSPLTEADLAAHSSIKSGLEELTPQIPQLSEEGGDIPVTERQSWPLYWLIDPLDGTREFIKKNGEFTVNIALIENGRPVLGVVHAPALDHLYSAAEGVGARISRSGGANETIRTRTMDDSTPRFLVSRSHVTPELENFLAKAPEHEPVSAGSALKFGLIAEGRADLYPRFGLTSEWDTGAGQCVVEQAGGKVVDLQFQPMRYNQRDTLLNPFFIVIGDPEFDWRPCFDD